MSNSERFFPRGVVTAKEDYLTRLRCLDPINIWYVRSLCQSLISDLENYKLHIWAIGSTVTGQRPQRSWNKPLDIDLLVIQDGLLTDAHLPNRDIRDLSLTDFERAFSYWISCQANRFRILESGFIGGGFEYGHLRNLGGAFIMPRAWGGTGTPINFIVPTKSKGGKESLEVIRQKNSIVLHPEQAH